MRSFGFPKLARGRPAESSRRRTRPILADGYTDVAPGKVATVVTYLEMRARPGGTGSSLPPGCSLEPIGADPARYRALFRAVGEPWLWFSRLVMPETSLAALLADPRVHAFALRQDGRDVGLLELDFRRGEEAELAFFGLIPDRVGSGLGRALMREALTRAFAAPIQRLTVHTCTLDHPAALGFYIRSGFVPVKRAVEIADDPRLLGQLPLEAAPHHPVMRP
ncbi:MAG TPA: GNAT family N-acetyltransferase [Beijerinckiaceae bacterium]|jgi:GNAT superfamily N-acetyltransferase